MRVGEGVGREVDGETLFKGRQVSLQEENDSVMLAHNTDTHLPRKFNLGAIWVCLVEPCIINTWIKGHTHHRDVMSGVIHNT